MRGKTYYIDPVAGDDAGDGLSPLRAWKSYATREFAGGDTVLFKRGSVIRDMLYTRNGTEQAPITYGAYGEGALPAFLGSVSAGIAECWVEERPSLWRYTGTFPSEVCNIVFNEGESCGILRWSIEDLRQAGDWHYTGIGKNAVTVSNPQQDLTDEVLYLCASVNPGLAYTSIECVLWGHRKLFGGEHDIIFEHLSFRNSGVHGYQEFHAQRVVIRNCEFRFIGGALWDLEHRIRFGNAIEFWDGASDITVEDCYFNNIYDSAVTHQGGETRNIPERIYFRNNLFVDCGLAAYECREPSQEIYFEYNTCVNAGGGFSMQGETPPRQSNPYPQPVGYHVFIWLIDPGSQPGHVYIRHNIFSGGSGAAISAVIYPVDARQFIIDHNCYWQTDDKPLLQYYQFTEGMSCNEAIKIMITTGELPIRQHGRSFQPSAFSRYQQECEQDMHSQLIEPQFVDAKKGDFRLHDASACQGMGRQYSHV